MLAFPSMMAPAARRLLIALASPGTIDPSSASLPAVVCSSKVPLMVGQTSNYAQAVAMCPARVSPSSGSVAMLSFTKIGMPCNALRST